MLLTFRLSTFKGQDIDWFVSVSPLDTSLVNSDNGVQRGKKEHLTPCILIFWKYFMFLGVFKAVLLHVARVSVINDHGHLLANPLANIT